MRFDFKPNALVLSMTLAACSGTRHTAEVAPVSPVPPQPAPTTPAAANSAPAAAPVVVATSADAVDASLIKAGYSVLRRHGEVLYCRSEIITGQRIATRLCLTAAQIQVEKQNVTKARDLMNQSNFSCLGGACKDP